MGFWDFFKKPNQVAPQSSFVQSAATIPTNTHSKQFDYFAFKVNGTATIQGAQEILKSIGCKLHDQPSFALVKLENDTLNVYLNGKLIGSGNAQAKNKFIEHCKTKWHIHSCTIYGGDDGKNYGCRIRIKYFY